MERDAVSTTLLEALAPHIDAMAMTNSVATSVRAADGQLMFDGQPRGICGEATREAGADNGLGTSIWVAEGSCSDLSTYTVGANGLSVWSDHVRPVRNFFKCIVRATHGSNPVWQILLVHQI